MLSIFASENHVYQINWTKVWSLWQKQFLKISAQFRFKLLFYHCFKFRGLDGSGWKNWIGHCPINYIRINVIDIGLSTNQLLSIIANKKYCLLRWFFFGGGGDFFGYFFNVDSNVYNFVLYLLYSVIYLIIKTLFH